MRIVLLGPPASGKGTQGRAIASRLGLNYLSTGALLREAIENRCDLGLAAEPILARGGYLPDALMEPILGEWLDRHDAKHGWVLDGFPRSLGQAQYLDQWLDKRGKKLDLAIALLAPYGDLISRIRSRVECPDCRWSGKTDELVSANCPVCGGAATARQDDDAENFKNRHAEYTAYTLPAIDYYRIAGNLFSVSATDTREAISAAILSQVESIF
ncbi:MAG: nucleoside monophosphate kinase [Verrucomicrobiota bacterium]